MKEKNKNKSNAFIQAKERVTSIGKQILLNGEKYKGKSYGTFYV